MYFKVFVSTVLLLSTAMVKAMPVDSVDVNLSSDTATVVHKNNIITKVVNYFKESNEDKIGKKINFSIIGGPHYSSDTKFALGLVAAGLYRTSLADSLITPSNLSIYADVSTIGFVMVGIKGYHIFPADKYRINYKVYFYSFPSKFWGIGYENGYNNLNETKYNRLQAKFEADFMFKLAPALYLGPAAEFAFVDGKKIKDHLELWQNEALVTRSYGVGFKASYDTRDNISNAYRGQFVSIEQRFFPRFLFNKYAFSRTELTANTYHRIWKGGVLAAQIHGEITYGNTPWSMLAELGGSESMRGYFEGRYRDKSEIDVTLELRQHIYHRNGAVVWAGAGSVFPKFSSIKFKQILPNYGIGYRWEFKNRVNVRLDYGFGRGQSGFVFQINEAF
ncbi:MAG: outer membrane protein assembly factor [Muribaculaceae bacterium]|nr:outer membrane protein assembly factor [Muribaculaceae bacterium]MDE5858384.1 outer membrane protein assembly factor [Muribaculaceae bacterium]MDE7370080.1 outer membrane protein assembly factor [Muribaculaceae bacterium]